VNGVYHPVDGVIRRWVRLYTLGLEKDARHQRRAEIDSDLWEHRSHAATEGEGSAATSLSILGRWVAGVPADLSWRALQRRGGRTAQEGIMPNTINRHWWQLLAALTAVATVYAGIRQFLTDEVSAGVSSGKVAALILFSAAGVLVLAGLGVHRTHPRRGALMVIIGVLPVALLGGFGIGILVGLVVSLAGGGGFWWVPIAIASAVATVAGLGAFGSWWQAAPVAAPTERRALALPVALLVVGAVAAGVGVASGWLTVPLLGLALAAALSAAAIWSRRTRAVR